MNDPKLVAASAIALAVTLFAIFSMRPWARKVGLVDKPGDRKRHRGHVPTIGGLCFFLGTLVGLSYLGYIDRFVASMMAGAAVVVVAGALDDATELSVRSRLLVEACAIGLVIAVSGFYVHDLGQLSGEHRLDIGLFGVPLTVFAVIGLINAFNMLDGIDGLAAGVAMVSIVAILMFDGGHWTAPGVLLLLQVLFAALIPYLCVNLGWPDGRKVFMGDAGSTLIGFLLAWSLIFLSHPTVARLAPVDVLWCVALPVMDTLAVMYRRVRLGRSPFRADRQHLHHLLLDAGLAPRITLVLMVAFSGFLVMVGYALREVPEPVSAAAFVVMLVAYVLCLPRLLAQGLPRLLPKAGSGGAGHPHTYGDDAPAPVAFSGVGVDVDVDAALEADPELYRDEGDGDGGKSKANGNGSIRLIPAGLAAPSPDAPTRLLCVFAASDAIRMAPIARQLARDERFDSKVCVVTEPQGTAAQVLSLFELEPDLELDVLAPDEDPAETTSTALGGIRWVMDELEPDMVLVPGDTSASLAATLAAQYRHVPVVCVDRRRSSGAGASIAHGDPGHRIARTLADLHVVPSDPVGQQLIAEGIPAERVLVVGDTTLGTLRAALDRLRQTPTLERELAQRYAFLRPDRPLLLVSTNETRHGDFDLFIAALRGVALQRPDVDVVCPLGIDTRQAPLNIYPIEPPDYLASIYLLARAHGLVAGHDSHGSLAEAKAMGVPVLTMTHLGIAATAGDDARRTATDARAISARILGLIDRKPMPGPASNLDLGDEGDASLRIVEALASLRSVAQPPETLSRDAGSPTIPEPIRGVRETSWERSPVRTSSFFQR